VLEHLAQYKFEAAFNDLPGFPAAKLISGIMPNKVPLFVLDCPSLYQREGGPYQDAAGLDWVDNAQRFGLLSRVAAVLGSNASPLGWRPDLVHCNDWQTGLAPAYLHFAPGASKSIITIHNLAFQGIFPAATVQALHLPTSCFSINGVEFHGNMSFLKAALFYADHITTVSPNYAKEIQQEALGFGLQGLLTTRSDDLTGILNGIDTDEWNPASDKHLVRHYSSKNMDGKSANKQALQSKFGLNLEPDVPLLGVVSRFTEQKGLDLLLEIAPLLTELPVQLAMLGTGETKMQKTARELSHLYPGKIGVHIGFSEEISHLIEAGADMFVMPSRFEPCGLNQFYSQRYGTPPIVHSTGGLADSVVDCTATTLRDGTASGFMFHGMTADNLISTTRRAVELYHDRKKWIALCNNCMSKDFSWESSARAYRAVYLKVLEK
jgi:starch synthase